MVAKTDFKDAKKLPDKILRRAAKALPVVVEQEIIGSINKGVSPVKGFGRFEKYSPSYRQQIKGEAYLDPESGEYIIFRTNKQGKKYPIEVEKKRYDERGLGVGKKVSPVNMRLSGEMLKSFFAKPFKKRIRIGFKSLLARYHNDGLGTLPVRRLLPTREGEEFSVSITKRITRNLEKIIKRLL